MAQEIRDIVFNIQVRTEDGKVKIDGLTKGFVNAETAFKRMQTTLVETNEAIKNTGVSTGLANTAVLEFGRAVSDAPYGIQGFGNNVTQLVTILGQMQGELKKGETLLGNFIKAMRGPLGIVVAVQIAVAAFEIFRRKQQEARKETKTYIDILSDFRFEVVKLEILAEVMNSNSASTKVQQDALQALKDNGYDPLTQSVDEFIDAQRRLALSRAAYELYAKTIASLEKERLELLDESKDTMADFFRFQEEGDPMVEILRPQVKVIKERLAEINSELEKEKERMKKIFEDEDLISIIFNSKKDKLKSESRDKVKKLVIETYDLSIVEAAKYKKEVERRAKELDIDFASIILGGEEGKKALGEGILGLVDGLEDTGTAERFKDIVRNAVFPEDILQGAVDISQIANDLLQSESERAIAIEQNKTNALNDQLKQRLANEQLSAEERDKINQQISKNETALVQRSNEINKKRFQQEKAFSIAQATINTYLAASDVLAKEKGGLAAKIIAMTVTIASGLAQVAAISRQQFTGQALPSPNLVAQGAGPAESQGPAFNIVGASGQSQLAQLISNQTSQPIKTYVVAGEVSTAQSLERNRVKEASI